MEAADIAQKEMDIAEKVKMAHGLLRKLKTVIDEVSYIFRFLIKKNSNKIKR